METKQMIRDYILNELVQDKQHADLSDSDQLIENGVIDSLGIIKLIGFLEDNLSIQVGDDELIPENFASVETISALVDSKKG